MKAFAAYAMALNYSKNEKQLADIIEKIKSEAEKGEFYLNIKEFKITPWVEHELKKLGYELFIGQEQKPYLSVFWGNIWDYPRA